MMGNNPRSGSQGNPAKAIPARVIRAKAIENLARASSVSREARRRPGSHTRLIKRLHLRS
jgi:hypothetical protein